jgi:hypothetical protein
MRKGMFSKLLRCRLRELGSSERGMALPVALFAMISSMALAGAAVVSSVDVQQGAKRDSGSKSAIAAADAGANVATMRLSRYANSLDSSPCLAESAGTLVTSEPAADGWCPPVAGTVGSAAYSYRVSPAGPLGEGLCGEYDLCIVSTGIVDGVSRRIEMTFNESTIDGTDEEEGTEEEDGGSGLGTEGLIGEDGIDINGTSADIRVGLGSNGDVMNNGNVVICGDIRVGIGRENTADQCSGYKEYKGNVNLPPVSGFMPGDIASDNANNRLLKCVSTNNPVECQKDTYTGNWKSKPPFDPATRTVEIGSGDALTVGGSGDYWICRLILDGHSELIMPAGAEVRFFFDTPENCKMPAVATQISTSGSSRIVSTGYQTSSGNFALPGFYLLGSEATATRVSLGGNTSTNELIVYGPETIMEFNGNASYKGLVAGKYVYVNGNIKMKNDAGFELPPELQPPPPEEEEDVEETPSVRYFTPQSYLECSGDAVSPPNASC